MSKRISYAIFITTHVKQRPHDGETGFWTQGSRSHFGQASAIPFSDPSEPSIETNWQRARVAHGALLIHLYY
jgi:hypothetical protein